MASSRDRKRRVFPVLLLLIFVITLARLAGPAVVSIRGDALQPILSDGDLVFVRRARDIPRRESVVLSANPRTPAGAATRVLKSIADRFDRRETTDYDPSPTVPRIVAGIPGDLVIFDINTVIIRGERGYLHRYSIDPLYEGIRSERQEIRLEENQVFLLSTDAGHADSRIIGAVSADHVRFSVFAILWPADRRTRL